MPMRLALPLLAPVALFACTVGPATPERVDLDRTLLQVRMSDGSVCEGPAPRSGGETGWSGVFQGCSWDYPYVVEIEAGTNPVRFVLEEVFTAIGLASALTPVATVRITPPDGRVRVFETPERMDDD